MYYEDRLQGRRASPACCWPARRGCSSGADACGASLEERLGVGVEAVDPRARRGAGRSHRRVAGAARRAGAAGRHAAARAEGGLSDAAHQPLDPPFYNDRAVRIAHRRGGARRARPDRLQRRRGLAAAIAERASSAPGRGAQRARRPRRCAIRRARSARRSTATSWPRSQAAAREANQLIDRRAFSWTDLFNRFEETLPPDVRIAAVQPQVDADGRMLVAVTVVSRRVEDLDEFIEALEETGAFTERAVAAGRRREEDGTLAVGPPGLLPPRAPRPRPSR